MTQERWTKLWKIVAAIALALSAFATTMAGIAIWAPAEEAVPRDYQCNVYTEQGCAKYVVADGGEVEVQRGGTIDLQAGSYMTVAAALDLTGTLNVDDAVTFNSSLDLDGNLSSGTGGISVTDSISVSGAANFDSAATFQSDVDIVGNLSSSTGGISVTDSFSVTGAVNFDSTLDAAGATALASTLSVGGDITLENGEIISNSTDGDVFVNGALLGFTGIVSKSAGYTLLSVESGSLCSNIGASTGFTWTLPAAATGLDYCFYLGVTQIITISPGASDLIHHLSNSAGDRITNTVAGDTLCLTAIDDVNWVPSNETGSWNDIN